MCVLKPWGGYHHFPVGMFRNGQRQRVLHVAPGVDLAVIQHYVQEGGLAQEVVHETVYRFIVQIGRGVDLHDVAHVADHHPVGDGHGFTLVMGYEDNGETEFALQGLDFETHAFPQLGVKVGQRFVQQHDLGVGDDGPG